MSNEELIAILIKLKRDYLLYRGSSVDDSGNILWAKDDAESWAEGLDAAIKIISQDNKELLERLWSDYDKNGVPYWNQPITEFDIDEIW
jgi:hypothetical protein